MAWWLREHERIDPKPANPSWRLPRYNNPQPLARVREKLWEIVGDEERGEEWFNALAHEIKPAGAISRFLDGDDEVLSFDQIQSLVRFEGEFGWDGRTNRLIRHPRQPTAGISVDPAPVRRWLPPLPRIAFWPKRG